MAQLVAAGDARATFIAKLLEAQEQDVEEESLSAVTENGESRPSAAVESAASELAAKLKHKELVRAAGRAAVEESLLGEPNSLKRKASEMTAERIAAQWHAYAEIYGTNGMAAGGARSSLVDPVVSLPDSPPVLSEAAVPLVSAKTSTEAVVPAQVPPERLLEAPQEVHASRGLAIWDF